MLRLIRKTLAEPPSSIISVTTSSVTLRPEFREAESQSPMMASAVSDGRPEIARGKGRSGKTADKGKSGGAAGWFLFILKVGDLGAEHRRYADEGWWTSR